MSTRRYLPFGILILCVAAASPLLVDEHADMDARTPDALVQSYSHLADTILAAKQTEWHLVHSILATTYSHAQGVLERAKSGLRAGESVQADLELLAALVSQLGTEGDAAVAAVRKRLIEGGHHHNAEGERQGLYAEGYVIVTRAAKQAFLDAAEAIGRIARAPDMAALDAEWSKVAREFDALHEDAGH